MAVSAAIAIARLGAPVAFWSRLGDDETGARYVRDLAAEGIDVSHLRSFAGMGTPFSSIIVDKDGERAVIPFYDAQFPADPGWLPLHTVAQAAAVLVDVRWQEGAAALLTEARRCGIPAILDADTAAPEVLSHLVPLATHVLFSEPGFRIYAGVDFADHALAEIGTRLGCDVAGVTLGPSGAALWQKGGNGAHSGVVHIAAPTVQAVDTLNAGDIWHGTFAWALCRGYSLQSVVEMANVAAAMKCEVFGGNLGAPTLSALMARAKTLGFNGFA
jgi:sugar/nucleoside kinase (ribokinase family)